MKNPEATMPAESQKDQIIKDGDTFEVHFFENAFTFQRVGEKAVSMGSTANTGELDLLTHRKFAKAAQREANQLVKKSLEFEKSSANDDNGNDQLELFE